MRCQVHVQASTGLAKLPELVSDTLALYTIMEYSLQANEVTYIETGIKLRFPDEYNAIFYPNPNLASRGVYMSPSLVPSGSYISFIARAIEQVHLAMHAPTGYVVFNKKERITLYS